MIFKKKYNKRNMETNIALERQEKKNLWFKDSCLNL